MGKKNLYITFFIISIFSICFGYSPHEKIRVYSTVLNNTNNFNESLINIGKPLFLENTSRLLDDLNINSTPEEFGNSKTINCSVFNDCYNCSATENCYWCSSLDCDESTCQADFDNMDQYSKLKMCNPEENAEMEGICPEKFDEIEDTYTQTISFPPKGRIMPMNGFCYWEIGNEETQNVNIEVINYSVIVVII